MDKRTFDDFDDYAEDYRSIHEENIKLSGADSYYFARMKVELLRPFEKNVSLKVLDIGCGDGATELFMNEYFSQWHIDAIDVSAKSIEAASKKNINNVRFGVYDGSSIPFPDENFDVVFMAGVLHHVDFSLHENLVKEIKRVLKKDGRFFLFEHNPLNPLTKYLVKTCVFDKDAKLLRSSYAKKLLKKAGFKITHTNFIIFFPRKGILSKFIFLEKWFTKIPFGGQYFMRVMKQ